MSSQRTHGSAAAVLLAVVVGVGSAGCGKAAFPKELFTVHGRNADYPVMVSETPGDGGREISASSGTQVSVSQSSYTSGNARVTVTTTRSARSELPASEKLAAQVRRSDKWVQIQNIEYEAVDFSTYGSSAAGRELRIDAEVRK